MMKEEVVLVDENDNIIGKEEKIRAHMAGKLHRAFSIFIFNSQGEMLLQKRARDTYHSGGLWTNACCGHPRPKETLEEAIHRRLKEEMGFDCELKKAFHFKYEVHFEHGLTEREIDHIFIGNFDGKPKPDPEEVESWKFANIEELKRDIKNPDKYTYWFTKFFEKMLRYLNT